MQPKIKILLLLGILGIGGLIYLISYEPSPQPLTGWKTYTNSTYQYSIQYPENWEVVNPSVEGGDIFAVDSIMFTDPEDSSYFVAVDVVSKPSELSIKDYLGRELDEIIVNGLSGYREVITADEFIYLSKDDRIYTIIFSRDPGLNPEVMGPQYYKIFEQILSTFQFIE